MKKSLFISPLIMAIAIALYAFGCYSQSTNSVTFQKMYGGSSYDQVSSIQQTSDGGYIVAGSSNSIDISGLTKEHSSDNIYIIKLDNQGNIVWQKMYEQIGFDHTFSAKQYYLGCPV
jgi:hypothetical protein